jgi:tetratricopeptide (TPR) repeat protein
MPKASSREGEHVVYTNHTIVRRPSVRSEDEPRRQLRSFWQAPAENRDLAIAYASLGGATSSGGAASPVLEKLRLSNDAQVLVQLGQSYDALGKGDLAEAVYERVLRIDPLNAAAGANLAIYRARKGRLNEAIVLWQDVFSRNPALSGAGINLALAQLHAGDNTGAGQTVRRILRFHPDLDEARRLLSGIP